MNLEMFMSNKAKKKRSALKTLICLAKLDKNNNKELKFLIEVAKRNNIEKQEFLKMMERSSNIKVDAPDNYQASLDYIYDLVLLTLKESSLLEMENDIAYVNIFANKLGLLGCETKNALVVRTCFLAVSEKKDKTFVIENLKSHLLI